MPGDTFVARTAAVVKMDTTLAPTRPAAAELEDATLGRVPRLHDQGRAPASAAPAVAAACFRGYRHHSCAHTR